MEAWTLSSSSISDLSQGDKVWTHTLEIAGLPNENSMRIQDDFMEFIHTYFLTVMVPRSLLAQKIRPHQKVLI